METTKNLSEGGLLKDAIFRIGEVFSVNGHEVQVKVERKKNMSYLIYQGQLIKNISVGGYIKITKGYIDIIGKVESEHIEVNKNYNSLYHTKSDEINRILIVRLLGFFEEGKYQKGVKELPLISNDCYLLKNDEYQDIHNYVSRDTNEMLKLNIGSLHYDDNVKIQIDGGKLFTSHFGIFGNTGSGKSYTLAKIYQELFKNFFYKSENEKQFWEKGHFLLFDFNGEYSSSDTITPLKKVYKLSTINSNGAKLPISESAILNDGILNILASATEKTQQPFINRTIRMYRNYSDGQNPLEFFKNTLKKRIRESFSIGDKTKTNLIIDYIKDILCDTVADSEESLSEELKYYYIDKYFYYKSTISGSRVNIYSGSFDEVKDLRIYRNIDEYTFSNNFLSKFLDFMYLQLINDLISNRTQNDHVAPVINKLKSIKKDIDKVFDVIENNQGTNTNLFSERNFIVVDLNKVNTHMKKIIPLVFSSMLYKEHKERRIGEQVSSTLNIIIDEAHNILSYESNRESETWKDFRLETFEEIIKEGRKFGVYLTIASQRPSDISPTIISQLHNYFIHRLINEQDLRMVANAVSYLDRVSLDALPTLPTGACAMSGVMIDLPILININCCDKGCEPKSQNADLASIWLEDKS